VSSVATAYRLHPPRGRQPALAGLRAQRDTTLDVDPLMVAAAVGALLIVIFTTSDAIVLYGAGEVDPTSCRFTLPFCAEGCFRPRCPELCTRRRIGGLNSHRQAKFVIR
jgi:hypothetical protein